MEGKEAEILNAPKTKKQSDFQDFSAVVEKKIPELQELANREKKLTAVIDNFIALEKQTRQGGDITSTSKVANALVTLCFEFKDWKALNESLVYISKRRGQLKQVIQYMVQEAMKFLPSISDVTIKIDLIKTLRNITEGKIFVEVERARLTQILSKIKEDAGNIAEAADILQEVQVETYGAMEPREKITFILEQMRLCLAKNDFLRTQIVSRKITSKALAKDDFQDLKIKYHELMIQYYLHDNDYLNVCRAYRAIYDTKVVQENKEQWRKCLALIAVNIVLAPHDNEQSDLIHRIYEDKNLLDLPKYRALIKYFITTELVRWPKLKELYDAELNQIPIFATEKGPTLWQDLRNRVVQHNIRVVAQYYERIRMTRLAELLDLSELETEKFVSDLVSNASVWARIDRPKAIISFRKKQEPNEVLNSWSHDIGDLLNLLEKTCHLIHRETMIHEAKSVAQ